METATKKMTAAQKRVLIAKDVLAQLKSRRFRPTTDTYLHEDLYAADDAQLATATKQLKTCTVCAVGACFVAVAERFDRIKFSDVMLRYSGMTDIHSQNMRRYLGGFFPAKQMAAIECAYMQCPTYARAWLGFVHKTNPTAAVDFGMKFHGNAARMRAIMQNVIDNGGTFKP